MSTGFILTDYGVTSLYEIPSFKQTGLVSHGFSTRLGGNGQKPYDTLNLAFHVGDSPETVIENRRKVCQLLGADIANLVGAQQVHGVNIAVVGPENVGLGALDYDSALPETDGLVTIGRGLMLATFYADCVPIFILDPVKKVVASIHAGWKGTEARIGFAAIAKMTTVFGSDPRDCLVGIGPSIGPCCYEVDEPVISSFTRQFPWWSDILTEGVNGRYRLDLWETNRKILVEAGVKADNIEIARVCTCCNQNILFSYRGSQGRTGRMGAFIMLKIKSDLSRGRVW